MAGWSYTPSNALPLSTTNSVLTPQGVNIDAAFMLQVYGFDGIRWPIFIGLMGGFFYYFGETGGQDSLGVDYGIYVKHTLFPGPRLRLFFGYGAGAAQVWIRNIDGRGVGAYERLSVGVDIRASRLVNLSVEFSYRFFDLPTFQVQSTDSGGYGFQTMSISGGVWFGR
jgi:hypothetical protein